MADPIPCTVMELFEQNGKKFPFWMSNDRPVHWVFLCQGFGYFWRDADDRKHWCSVDPDQPGALADRRYEFVGDVYTIDKMDCQSQDVSIAGHNYPGWLAA